MKWSEFIKDYLTFTRKERIGILMRLIEEAADDADEDDEEEEDEYLLKKLSNTGEVDGFFNLTPTYKIIDIF